MPSVEVFENMLAQGQDSPLLRHALGSEYLKQEAFDRAVEHLRAAVEQDPGYSAAWKLLGKSLVGAGDTDAAMQAYRSGIDVAQRRGDKQAEKEMQVFLRRLQKDSGDAGA